MATATRVTRVEIDNWGGDVSATLTIQRGTGWAPAPDPNDVPTDLRNALRKWLDRAE